MTNQPEHVFITGAGGFVGNAALTFLGRQRYNVVGIGRNNSPAAKWVRVDLASLQAQRELDSLDRPNVVVHCAASVPKSFAGGASRAAAESNLVLDQFVIDYCARRGARLVYCSSSSVYGLANEGPIDEDHSVDETTSHYTRAKILSENLIREQLRSYAILRISAPYGPGQSARTVLRNFIETAIAGGTLLYHGTGSRRQDFLHVNDLAKAIRAAIDNQKVVLQKNLWAKSGSGSLPSVW